MEFLDAGVAGETANENVNTRAANDRV